MTQAFIFLVTIILTFSILSFSSVDSFEWGYSHNNGPSIWRNNFYNCGNTRRQSPIIIDSFVAVPQKYFMFNLFHNTNIDGELLNNGHTVEYSYTGSKITAPYVHFTTVSDSDILSGGSYVFAQLHFHWGSVDDKGQEHIIDNTTGVGEIHLVYYNSIYDNLTSAVYYNNLRGLLVFGYILEVCTSNLDSVFGSNGEYIDQVKYYGNTTAPYTIRLDSISNPCVPSSTICNTNNTYYVYEGSLTTPHCNEIVTWLVSAKKLCISQNQLNKLRQVKDKAGETLADNFRDFQNLNGRIVHVTSMVKTSDLQFPTIFYLMTVLFFISLFIYHSFFE